MEVRQIHLFVQEIAEQAGRPVRPPALRAACCAVLANPLSGRTAGDDFEQYVAASVSTGELLTRRALDALGGRAPVAYGKGALVGEGGDLEQGAAMIHCRIGLAMRSAIRAGSALIPGNAKMGGPGTTLDIVLGGSRAANGMASFADVLTPEQAESIHHYLVARARDDWED